MHKHGAKSADIRRGQLTFAVATLAISELKTGSCMTQEEGHEAWTCGHGRAQLEAGC